MATDRQQTGQQRTDQRRADRGRVSAGVLLFRRVPEPEFLIAHPGGPLWARKDEGAWTIPKGLTEGDEDPLTAARREFAEETGTAVPDGAVIDLGTVRQASGKTVYAFAVEGDLEVTTLVSNTFEMTWPPRSGRTAQFPEIDRAQWSGADEARVKLNPAQAAFVDRLLDHLAGHQGTGRSGTGRSGTGEPGTAPPDPA